MAANSNNRLEQNSPNHNENDEKSFVGKFKSIISNTPLSKWFGRSDKSAVRRREEDAEDDLNHMQPPAKRLRLPESVDSVDYVSGRSYHFPEPVAGPSGLNSIKSTSNRVNTYSELLNGHKDSDSEESTSGYSSVARIGSKEQVFRSTNSSKQTSPVESGNSPPPATRSLFQSPVANSTTNTVTTTPPNNRTLFSIGASSPKHHHHHHHNNSLSSRRPCFNASTFGSPSFIDKTISTEKIINSPFYNGTTIYGGASAYSRSFTNSNKPTTPIKKTVNIKPVNRSNNNSHNNSGLVLGKTARKILETLEQYSTPVNDAKKIPVTTKNSSNTKRYRLDNSEYSKASFNRELQVPNVSDLLRMKQKQKAELQSRTEAVRQIANTTATTTINKRNNKVVTDVNNADKDVVSDTFTNKSSSGNNKIVDKGKDKVVDDDDRIATATSITNTVNKESVTITKTSVTTNNTLNNNNNNNNEFIINKKQQLQQLQQQQTPPLITLQYKFSNPLIIADNLKSIVAMNNFKFSDPVSNWTNKATKSDTSPPTFTATPSIYTYNKAVTKVNNGQNVTPPNLLDKFKPAPGVWECDMCLIRNKPDDLKCAACDTSKTKTSRTTPNESSKMKSLSDDLNAAANANDKTSSTVISASGVSTWGDKFKPASDTWECSTCLIRNKNGASKCAACETPRATSAAVGVTGGAGNTGIGGGSGSECGELLASKFKLKEGEWNCDVCLVKNSADHAKCQCCEAQKPGTTTTTPTATNVTSNQDTIKKSTPKFNFGIDQKLAASFSFGIPPSSSKDNNKSTEEAPKTNTTTTTFNPIVATTTSTPTFTFGVVAAAAAAAKPQNNDDVNKKSTVDGLVKDSVSSNKEKEATTATALIKPVIVTKTVNDDDNNDVKKSKVTTAPTFTFNSLNSGIKTSDVTAKVTATTPSSLPTFNFGAKLPENESAGSKFTFATAAKSSINQSITTTTIKDNNKDGNGNSKSTSAAAPAAAAAAFTFGATAANAKPNTSFTSFDINSSSKAPITFGAKPTTTTLDNSSSKPFGFVSAAAAAAHAPTNSNTGEPAAKATMLNFGQSASAASTPASTPKPTGFNFGAAAAAATNKPTSISTSFTSQQQQLQQPVFNFSAPKSDTFGFGGSGSSGSSSKNGIFTFGSHQQTQGTVGGPSAAAAKVGFNFGAAAAVAASPVGVPSGIASAAQSSTTGFSFGGAAAAANVAPVAPTGGFNFSSAFDANAKPSFNFSDSPVAFSAQTTEGAIATRKIKRPIRRTR